MSFGLGVLRLCPRDFWAMTPVELAALARSRTRRANPPDRAALEALEKAFPDTRPERP